MENKKIMHGVLHTHSENSKFDSALKVNDLVKHCADLGAPAIALTDHGVMTGIYEFIKACKKHNINPVPGVEAYIKEDDSLLPRSHFILMAKDHEGLKAINRIVTESNKRIENGIPHINIEILKRFVGPGTKGHGHVIATSACVGGVLARILLSNKIYNDKIKILKKRQAKYSNPNSTSYKNNQNKLQELTKSLDKLIVERDELNLLAKKTYVRKEKSVEALKGTDMYEEARKNLDLEIAETKSAQIKLETLRAEISKNKKTQSELKKSIKKQEEDFIKWKELNNEIKSFQNEIKPDDLLFEEASTAAIEIESIFGKGNFFIELQYHRIDNETYVMPKLVKLSKLTGIPVVAANDVHVARNNEDDFKARQIIRSLKYNKWEERNIGDEQLYIKTDKELADILSEVLEPDIVTEAINNISVIFKSCKFELQKTSHYPKFLSDNNESAFDRLKRLAYEGIPKKYPDNWDKSKEERLLYELDTIKSMGYCDYFCIVEDYIKEAKRLGKLNDEQVGCGVGPGRGSVAGSIVANLLGITSVDPILYNLLFERFLNKDRVSMPDIDVDFHRDIRGQIIEYVKNKYGVDSCCHINTKDRQMARGSIRNCARLLGSEKHDDPLYYTELGDTIAKSIPKSVDNLNGCYDTLKGKFKNNADAMEIIHNAMLVEGTMTAYGMHAAGLIICESKNISEHVALMWDENNELMKCQADMNEAEELGLLKMDFLGLKNLDIITNTLRSIKRRRGISIDIETIEFKREVFDNIYAKGFTNSVFQFESSGMKQMLKEFKPTKFEDIILLVAAYRPGPMDYIPKIIAVKNGRAKPNYIIPEMSTILDETYGYPIYQEQVIEIFNKFAGFSMTTADNIRRLMSKKKEEAFKEYEEPFIDGMVKSGASKKDAEQFWDELLDFAKYAFNKSHAAAYALVSYQTAWLKYYYPLEFISETLSVLPIEKYTGLIADCKALNIEVLAPNINLSKNGFSIYNNSILFGLSSVKNVGASSEEIIKERETGGLFTSFQDFLLRSNLKKDVTESLIKAGAFDEFNQNRKALLYVFRNLVNANVFKKIKDKTKILADASNSEKKMDNASKALKSLYLAIKNEVIPDNYPENQLDKLKEEKDMLGAFVTSHPTDEYLAPEEYGCVNIADLTTGKNFKVLGLITNLRLANRKTDGKQMAFFTLEDKSGSIEVSCFTKAFEDYGNIINKEGNVVLIKGDVFEEFSSSSDFQSSEDDTANIEFTLNMIKADNVEPNLPKIIIHVPNLVDWTEKIYPIICNYRSSVGNPLIVHDMMMEEYRETDLKVISKDLLNNNSGLKVSMI